MTPGGPHVLLETARLRLRRFTPDDADLLFELDSDPEVVRFTGPGHATVQEYRDKIAGQIRGYYAAHPARGFWAAEAKATDEFLGWFVLRPGPDYRFAKEAGWTHPGQVEVGYRLRRSAWGKGVATEGAAALVELALADPEVTEIVAAALVTNLASCRVLGKVGLRRAAEFPIPGFDAPLATFSLPRPGG